MEDIPRRLASKAELRRQSPDREIGEGKAFRFDHAKVIKMRNGMSPRLPNSLSSSGTSKSKKSSHNHIGHQLAPHSTSSHSQNPKAESSQSQSPNSQSSNSGLSNCISFISSNSGLSSNLCSSDPPETEFNPKADDSSESQEFLPICDALFNVISLLGYFCDIVFDALTAYSFYRDGFLSYAIIVIFLILLSIVCTQLLSLKWYYDEKKKIRKEELANSIVSTEQTCSVPVLLLLHVSLCGVLWRYFKLFIPVDLRHIKNEVRNLCLLRLVHAFTEAGPMLILQLYVIWGKPSPSEVSDLNIVSTALSLFSVCWALASFSKNIRRQNVHKLVLTWLGVIFQFLWRLGTVTSRVVALSVYASVYHYWLFLVIGLHWVSMLLWLLFPKNGFHGEKMGRPKKLAYSAIIAVVYIFCYIHVENSQSRQKVLIYYVTMVLENSLLLGVWLIATYEEEPWYKELTASLVFGSFAIGVLFMFFYYRFFHVKRLSYASYAYESGASSTIGRDGSSTLGNGGFGNYYTISNGGNSKSTAISALSPGGKNFKQLTGHRDGVVGKKLPSAAMYNKINGHHIHTPNVPGVFNCRFNPAIKRKKKKPTSFVPPPNARHPIIPKNPLHRPAHFNNNNNSGKEELLNGDSFNDSFPNTSGAKTGKMANPFWKRPLSVAMGSEEGSVGSRVDIQQKLQEKKKQQLAELREIEEEIKSGKLKRPQLGEIREAVPAREPIPCEKKQPWFRSDPPVHLTSPRPPIIIPGEGHDELILDPTYLMYSPANFYEQPEWNYYEPIYQNEEEGGWENGKCGPQTNGLYKSYRIPSDIDSQMSLPRSYTLPREFKFRRKLRKPVKNEHFLPSTNSSDGDVDSGEDNQEVYSQLSPYPLPVPSVHHVHVPSGGHGRKYVGSRRRRLHETKL